MYSDVTQNFDTYLFDVVGLIIIITTILFIFMATFSWIPVVIAFILFSLLDIYYASKLTFTLYDISIGIYDFISVSIIVATAIRVILGRIRNPLLLLWIAVSAFFFLGFLRGGLSFGVQTAANSFRPYLYVLAAITYMGSFFWSGKDLDRFARYWVVGACALALFATMIIIFGPQILAETQQTVSYGGFLDRRTINARYAEYIMLAGVLCCTLWLDRTTPTLPKIVGLLLVPFAVFLFHRSVWISGLVAFAALITIRPQPVTRLGWPLLVAATLITTLAAISQGMGISLWSPIAQAIQEPFDNNSTWVWRVEGWQALLQRFFASSVPTLLFGSGFGTGYSRFVRGAEITVSAHSAYVEILLNTGLVGLGGWIYCHLATVWYILKHALVESYYITRTSSLILLAALLAYSIPYSPTIETSILLGVFVGFAGQSSVLSRMKRG
jgi:hypothetical protein